MKLIICNNYDEVSSECAKLIANQITENSRSILGLATGSTPIGAYSCLSKMYAQGKLDFSDITSFNLDEYYPIAPDNSQSYRYFMDKHLFSKVNIKKENTHIPNGMAKDSNAECERYDKLLSSYGGVDLQLLGIGQNGHIGFNEPAEAIESKTHVTELTKSTIDANSRFFDSPELVPTHALTMGVGTILSAKKIILLACGKNKHEALSEVFSGKVKTTVPATLLNLHRDVTIICDKEAYYGK